MKKGSGSDLKQVFDAYYGERRIETPKATYTLADPIVIDNIRGSFQANWATVIPPSGQFAFEVKNGYSYSLNPNGIFRDVIIDGNSRAGKGLLIRDHQGFKLENAILTDCDVGIQLTSTVSGHFSEGNCADHVHILAPNVGVEFLGGTGTNSFMDAVLRDFRVNLTVAGSRALKFNADVAHCKPHTSVFEKWHIWYKAANTVGVEVVDDASYVTQLWHSVFRNFMNECYDVGGTAIGMKFGTSLDAAQKIHFEPMPYFIVTSGGVYSKRISNPNNKCLGDGIGCLNDNGFITWTPDGTKIYRTYVSNAGAVTPVDITASYDNN